MNIRRLLVPLHALTLLLSAFLLFAVQPLLGKLILPMLGGAPTVWNAAMVFFQALLLAGYAYAHGTSRVLRPAGQAVLHLCVLVACAAALPVAIPAGWNEAPVTGNPFFWQLAMMSVAAGGPFFALAATAPMLQRWFSLTGHRDAPSPYFLYGASNLGSMAALLSYPFLIEPHMTVGAQTKAWAWGYGALVALTAACALADLGGAAPPRAEAQAAEEPLTPGRVGLWLLLTFLPSSLMLGVTTFITTDIAAVPLLWTVPLALYTLSFIVAFARRWPVRLESVTMLQAVSLVAAVLLGPIKMAAFAAHLVLFLLSALMCHMQLAQERPSARDLTAFYLAVAAGGAAGGVFNTLAAPALFPFPLEYPLALAAAAFLRCRKGPAPSFAALRRIPFAAAAFVLLAVYPGFSWRQYATAVAVRRNFFGVLRVSDVPPERLLFSGATIHGAQALDAAHRKTPLSYYSRGGPAGDVFAALEEREGGQRVAALGLGLGSIACYARPGRHFDFFEIDPEVVRIAQDPKLFTFLSGCGSDYKVVMGDARLSLAKTPDRSYDLIFVDTFSGDNVPVHMLTAEAFRLYFRKLKPGGLLAVNVSNRYLALERVVAAAARDLNVYVLMKTMKTEAMPDSLVVTGARYAVLAEVPGPLAAFPTRGWRLPDISRAWKSWGDDYSDIASVLVTP